MILIRLLTSLQICNTCLVYDSDKTIDLITNMMNVNYIWSWDTIDLIANMQDMMKIWFGDAIYLVTNTSNNMISIWSWENIDLMIIYIYYKKGIISKKSDPDTSLACCHGN